MPGNKAPIFLYHLNITCKIKCNSCISNGLTLKTQERLLNPQNTVQYDSKM